MPATPKPDVFKTPHGWTWILPGRNGDHYSREWLARGVAVAIAKAVS